MGRATLDLGAIMGLFGQQTPESNPLYGATADDDSPSGWSYAADGNGNKQPVTDPDHIKQLNDSSFKNNPDGVTGGNLNPDIASQRFTDPSRYAQIFHPEMANYETKANIAGVQAGTDANIGRQALATPLQSQSPQQANIFTGGNPSAAGYRNAIANQVAVNNGLPQAQTDADIQNLKYQQEKTASERRILGQFQFGGGEEKTANNQITGLDASTGRNIQQSFLQPRETQLTYNTMGNEIDRQNNIVPVEQQNQLLREQAQTPIIPIQARGALAAAQTGAAQAQQGLTDLPYTLQAQHLGDVGGAYQSQFMPSASAPFATKVNSDGTVMPNTRMPFTSMLNTLNAKVSGDQSTGGIITPIAAQTKDGKQIPLPPSSVYAPKPVQVLQGQPSIPPITQPITPRMPLTESEGTSEDTNVTPEGWKGAQANEMKIDQVPLQGRPGYTFDGDGNIYYQGEKVKLIAGSDIPEEAKKQLNEMERQNYFKQNNMGYRAPITSGIDSIPFPQ